MLTILEVSLIICLESRFLIHFLFCFLCGGFNYTRLAIISCDGNGIDNGDDDNPGLGVRFVGGFLFILKYIFIKKILTDYYDYESIFYDIISLVILSAQIVTF